MAFSFDPFYRKVALLLPFDGSDGSTAFTDVSEAPVTVSVGAGSPVISTAQSVFGGSSLRLPGGGAHLAASSSKFANSQREAGLSLRFRLDSIAGTQVLFDQRASTGATERGMYLAVLSSGALYFQFTGNVAAVTSAASTIAANTWYQVFAAYEQTGGTNQAHRLYLNGAYLAQGTFAGGFADATATSLRIGADVAGVNSAAGYIDDLRFDVGVARYRNQQSYEHEIDGPWPTVYGSGATVLPLAQTVQAFAPTWPVAEKIVERAIKVRDVHHGGFGQIAGTVKRTNSPDPLPLARKVRLFRDRDAVCVGETWSDATTGNYAFVGVDPVERYSVVSYDHAGVFRAVIADNLLPTAYP